MALELPTNPFSHLVFLDCEAIGLHQPSHPVEIGLAWCDERTQAYLVKPASIWQDWVWDPAAEKIHGIPRDQIEDYGKDVRFIADWLNSECCKQGMHVFSDNPAYESYWVDQVFIAANRKRLFPILNSYRLVGEAIKKHPNPFELFEKVQAHVSENAPVTHRADEDALHWAILYKEIIKATQEQEG